VQKSNAITPLRMRQASVLRIGMQVVLQPVDQQAHAGVVDTLKTAFDGIAQAGLGDLLDVSSFALK